ncbi:MAG: GtrA family protein [Candidatus Omnitrophica bacterium]|nr:GtrA family protein [Candidatus Omnitrophota bacterium]
MSKTKEIIRFSISGIFVVATDASIYYLLIRFLPSAIAKGISFTCGGIVAYLLNKYWTFKQEEKSTAEIFRFVFANSLALGLNIGINEIILYIDKQAVFLALAIATAITAIFTFIVFKFWVFKSKG